MFDAIKQVGIFLRDVVPNDQAVVHAFVMKSFEYTEHIHTEHAYDMLMFPDCTEAIDIFTNQGGAWLETQYPQESRDDYRFIIDNTVLNLPIDVRDVTTNLLWESCAISKGTCRCLHDLLR